MTRTPPRRPQRKGFVLIVVLLLLLMLGVVAASLLSTASETDQATILAVSQRVAASRADTAAQLAVATIASGTLTIAGLTACGGPGPSSQLQKVLPNGTNACVAAQMISSGMVSGPNNGNFETGSGLLYQWWIYRRPLMPGVPANQQLVRIYAEGYWGGATTSPNFTGASVEADIIVPTNTDGSGEASAEFIYGG
jgi:hypothetical protein